ncbi:head decoration protein [Methylobacterium brachythecii]|uniref:Head decoration protein n=1 Tax=Methylobacterium brachythecii TaxID=1176177 RepID=A0A7W6F873_9HYPH|nr:head decoration protein [Methylobacterium brachythecii]MBB3904192.1 hypothetical protein [Methylobacterium brachythecii]GLS45146.1 hypothetical protein GCM10007884_31350 [Methylobacterium brachythecii]
MGATLNSPVYVSDWLKYEAGSYYSRGTGTVASGSGALVSGTVLAKVAASGKYVPAAATGSDGTQTATAILVAPVDATSVDAPCVVIENHALVSHAGLTWGSTINDATKRAAAIGQLRSVGIKVREGA